MNEPTYSIKPSLTRCICGKTGSVGVINNHKGYCDDWEEYIKAVVNRDDILDIVNTHGLRKTAAIFGIGANNFMKAFYEVYPDGKRKIIEVPRQERTDLEKIEEPHITRWKMNCCPKCKGSMYLDSDIVSTSTTADNEVCYTCVNCGHSKYYLRVKSHVKA